MPVECERCGELTEDGRMRHFLCGAVVCRSCYERESEGVEATQAPGKEGTDS